MAEDWRGDFRKFKKELRSLYDIEQPFFHCVVLSANKTPSEISALEELLEPAIRGCRILRTVDVQTDGCRTHHHYFLAEYGNPLHSFIAKIEKLDKLLSQLPLQTLPTFYIPNFCSRLDSILLTWMSILYHLAWRYDEVYCSAWLEYRATADVDDSEGFYPWYDCPQPAMCDPGPWLIHQGDDSGRVATWQAKFEDAGFRFPEVISTFLEKDVVFSSIAAIDILTYQLWEEINGCRTTSTLIKTENQQLATVRRRRRPHSEANSHDLILLQAALMRHHRGDSDIPVHEPISQDELAELLTWSQARVSRRMAALFPHGGMKQYRQLCKSQRGAGFVKRLNDGTRDVDGIVEDPSPDDDLQS